MKLFLSFFVFTFLANNEVSSFCNKDYVQSNQVFYRILLLMVETLYFLLTPVSTWLVCDLFKAFGQASCGE